MENADGILSQRFGSHLKFATADRPGTAIGEKSFRTAGVEIGSSQDIAGSAWNISGLGIIGSAGLRVPIGVFLQNQSQLAVRLTITIRRVTGIRRAGHIHAVTLGQIVQVFRELRLQGPADRGRTKRRERYDIGIEFPDPVDETVAAGIGDQHIPSGTAVRDILITQLRTVRHVVRTAIGAVIVIHVHQVIAASAVCTVLAGAAHDPVITQVTENTVISIGVHHSGSRIRQRSFRMVKIEEKFIPINRYFCPGIVFQIRGELFRPQGIGAQNVTGINRTVKTGFFDSEIVTCVIGGSVIREDFHLGQAQGLGAGHRVIPRAAMHEVHTPATEHNVIGEEWVEQRILH